MLGRCRQYGDPRLLEVTEERDGPSGLRDDDDDDDDEVGEDFRHLGQLKLENTWERWRFKTVRTGDVVRIPGTGEVSVNKRETDHDIS